MFASGAVDTDDVAEGVAAGMPQHVARAFASQSGARQAAGFASNAASDQNAVHRGGTFAKMQVDHFSSDGNAVARRYLRHLRPAPDEGALRLPSSRPAMRVTVALPTIAGTASADTAAKTAIIDALLAGTSESSAPDGGITRPAAMPVFLDHGELSELASTFSQGRL